MNSLNTIVLMMFDAIPNDITTYIYKLIHNDVVLNLNREYKDIVIVKKMDRALEPFSTAIQGTVCIALNHPACKIRSNRSYFYFNYRDFQFDEIFNIKKL